MKLNVIDHVITTIQNVADKKGYDIDHNSTYVRVCKLLADYEFGEDLTLENKRYIAEALEMLCSYLRINYFTLIHEALEKF